MTKKNKDLLWGFIPSMILPLIFMSVFIYFNYHGTLQVKQVAMELFRINQLSSLLAVGAVPNLLLFLFSINRERWQLGRGVIAATLFYGIAVMILKIM